MNKNKLEKFFKSIQIIFSRKPAIYMYVDVVDVLLNDSNKKKQGTVY